MFSRSRRTTNGRKKATSNSSNGKQTPSPSSSPPPPPFPLPLPMDGSGNAMSSTDYALKCRELMDLYRTLRNLGASIFFDLPKVVVIGGQSSGKSSLVEAVSGINVPRDSGTCTRCPMECTMSSDATSWSCTIEIRYEFDNNGSAQTPKTESFGTTIENKADVELWIRRAQAAVLSPHRARSDFLAMSARDLKEKDPLRLPFSKNVVQVNVKDPEATDLNFVDLPGLIQNETDELIATVRSLVEAYVKGKNTLIVIAMPMTDDYEMIQAVRLAKNPKADPKRERTIGVFTKPDMLPRGATTSRMDVLEGREHVTKHGYYCVRLPDDEQRSQGISSTEARENADAFFNSTAPWNQMPDRSRLGIPNFVKDVSALLVGLIEKNLPSLRAAVESELQKCAQDLAALPPALSNGQPSTEVILRVTEFCKDIRDAVMGDKHKHFVQANRDMYFSFKKDIELTTPDFRPASEGSTVGSTALVVSRTPPLGLGDVRKFIKDSLAWELPGFVPYEAAKAIIVQYTKLWKEPTMTCFDNIARKGDAFIGEMLRNHFGRFTALEKYIRKFTFEERDQCMDEARSMLEKILRMEINPPFTQNLDFLKAEETKWNGKYLEARKPRNREQYWGDHHLESYASGSTWVVREEVRVMSTVQAYFQVASKRFVDYVPLTIEHELNQSFASDLGNMLFTALFNDTEAGRISWEDLLMEDPVLAAKRKDLEERNRRLLLIKEKLDGFGWVESSPITSPATSLYEAERFEEIEEEEEYVE